MFCLAKVQAAVVARNYAGSRGGLNIFVPWSCQTAVTA
jgi:hypothetical protein